ncbi:MAG: hypothetical protein AAF628_17815 [Planctomycetota bacterium]
MPAPLEGGVDTQPLNVRQQPLSGRKKAAFAATLAVLMLLCIELLAQGGFYATYGFRYRPGRLSRLSRAINAIPSELHNDAVAADNIVHPYVGYVRDVPPDQQHLHGFWTLADELPRHRVPGAVNVLVTGGSVALEVGYGVPLTHVFREVLCERRRGGVAVRVFTAALGGMKQPQQLMILNWLATQGAVFDVVVNLDGFNDVVLPVFENAPAGVHPAFPRGWAAQLRKVGAGREVGELAFLRRAQMELVQAAQGGALASSALLGLYYAHAVVGYERRIATLGAKLMAGELAFQAKGPPLSTTDRDVLLAESVDVWARGSRLMGAVAAGLQAEYFHFLQPNQYVRGSKPLSAEERRLYYTPRDDETYGPTAVAGYPLLIARGAKLLADGVKFVDATPLFADDQQTLYRDTCCHFNREGNVKLARFVVEYLLEHSTALQAAVAAARDG